MRRRAAYHWLAGKLGIEYVNCHIGQMNRDMAERVVFISREFFRENGREAHAASSQDAAARQAGPAAPPCT
jgi:hypothetical protein